MYVNKEIKKNRTALITELYIRKPPPKKKEGNPTDFNDECYREDSTYNVQFDGTKPYCLCVQGISAKIFGYHNGKQYDKQIRTRLGMTKQLWDEMEWRYEGIRGFEPHTYIEVADWLINYLSITDHNFTQPVHEDGGMGWPSAK